MTTLMQFTDAMKYLGRLDKVSFKMLLFPDATEDYLDAKWEMFGKSPLHFFWSCSSDKLDIITGWLSSDFDVDLFYDNDSFALGQTIEKEHMERMTKESIDDKEWTAFCKQFIDAFAEDVSGLAKIYWSERTIYESDEE